MITTMDQSSTSKSQSRSNNLKSAVRLVVPAILSSFLVLTITASAASNPKTTGDADWRNPYSGQETNLTFNALAIKPTGPGAKGSAIYTDPNVTYTMDVQFVQVSGNTAWFAGQVTSVTPADGYQGCCHVNDWVFYQVQDNGEPGANNDLIWGEDVTQSGRADDSPGAATLVNSKATPNMGLPNNQGIAISGGNIQVH